MRRVDSSQSLRSRSGRHRRRARSLWRASCRARPFAFACSLFENCRCSPLRRRHGRREIFMAALDPRYEFQFDLGAPTAANLNLAAGSPLLSVGATHLLYVASGNSLPVSATTPGRYTVSRVDVHIACLKVHKVDAALQGTLCSRSLFNLKVCHDAFSREGSHSGHAVSIPRFSRRGSC